MESSAGRTDRRRSISARNWPRRSCRLAVAAYGYMSLVPLIQPPVIRLLTTKADRSIKMEQLRPVSRTERILFPIVSTLACGLVLPAAVPLIGMLMFGNLMRECGCTERLSLAAQNEVLNATTIFLGISVGATMSAETFLTSATIKIICHRTCRLHLQHRRRCCLWPGYEGTVRRQDQSYHRRGRSFHVPMAARAYVRRSYLRNSQDSIS